MATVTAQSLCMCVKEGQKDVRVVNKSNNKNRSMFSFHTCNSD